MSLKSQLNLTILTNVNQERGRIEEQQKLRSEFLIDERLTELLLEEAKTSSKDCLRIKERELYCRGDERIYDSRIESSFELTNGYIITPEDVKMFCKKNKFKLRYEYIYKSFYYRQECGPKTYKKYKGIFLPKRFPRKDSAYFYAYLISVL